MLRPLLGVAMFGTIAAGSLLFTSGCANDNTSESKPEYGLTGTSQTDPAHDPHNLDDKGHYHPEWAAEGQ